MTAQASARDTNDSMQTAKEEREQKVDCFARIAGSVFSEFWARGTRIEVGLSRKHAVHCCGHMALLALIKR